MNPLLLLGFLSSSGLINGPTPIAFKSAYDDWAVTAEASGQVSASEDEFTIALDKVTMTAPAKSAIRVRGYRVCIAYQNEAPEWAVANCSQRISHPVKLHPGESVTLDPVTLVISKNNLPEMDKSWFVVDVEVGTDPTSQEIGHVYSNSDVGFGGKR